MSRGDDSLRCGELSLEALAVLAPHVKTHPELLRKAVGLGTRGAKALVAAEFPNPAHPRGTWSVTPVGKGLLSLQVVVTTEEYAKLNAARDLDRHRNPQGDMAHTLVAGADCRATAFLEIDHIMPRALGGQHTRDNGRLLCRGHNQYEAHRILGLQASITPREDLYPVADPGVAAHVGVAD